jgi:hypothetical protein
MDVTMRASELPADLAEFFEPVPEPQAGDVWSIATQPYAAAHFATFPEALPRKAILAGTSERGVCPQCGAPWTRVVVRTQRPRGDAFGVKDIGRQFDHGQGGSPYIMVALQLGRSAIGIELSPTYADLARRRILDDHGATVPLNGHTPDGMAAVQGRMPL